MKFSKSSALVGIVFAATLALGHSAQAQARSATQSLVAGNITRTGTAQRGTTEYETIRQFILSHSGKIPNYAERLADARTAPTSFQVSMTSAVHSAADFNRVMPQGIPGPYPNPPVPLPSGPYQTGDVFTITSSTGGYTQEWDYTYNSGPSSPGWELTGYGVHKTPPSPLPKPRG